MYNVAHWDYLPSYSEGLRRFLRLSFSGSQISYQDYTKKLGTVPRQAIKSLTRISSDFDLMLLHPGINAQDLVLDLVQDNRNLEVALLVPGTGIDYRLMQNLQIFSYGDLDKIVKYITSEAKGNRLQ